MPKLKIVQLPGDGIGSELARHLQRLANALESVDIEFINIENFRLESGELDPNVVEIFRMYKYGIKGPTKTPVGNGPRSVNVALRQMLKLYANIRPICCLKGVDTPVKRPEDVNVVIFRENTEDVYAGIEAEVGSEKAKKLLNFLIEDWKIPYSALPNEWIETGLAIKVISREASEKIMDAALRYAIQNKRKSVTVVHKGNIMKSTEGSFMKWCLDYAKTKYANYVYFKEEADKFSKEEKDELILVKSIIADESFQVALMNPKSLDVIVTPNLTGDLLSDAIAAQVGGVPLAAGGNIGDDCAVFEAIGGTADDIAGKDIVNPTAYFFAFAMLLDYAGFHNDADSIRNAIALLFEQGIGTSDMKLNQSVSTTEFTDKIMEIMNAAVPA